MGTSEISRVYMSRPQEIACLGLGQWFVTATSINDKELCYSNTADAKALMIQRGYLEIPGLLDILKGYNHKFVEK